MNSKSYISLIRNYIAGDNLEDAIEYLSHLVANSPRIDEIILQRGRYNALKQQIRLGMLEHGTATVERNRLRAALLEFLGEIQVSLESDAVIKEEITLHAATISQTHSGSGDNVGRDKIVNIHALNRNMLLILLFLGLIIFLGWYWRNKQLQKQSLQIVSHIQDTSSVAPRNNMVLLKSEGIPAEHSKLQKPNIASYDKPSAHNSEPNNLKNQISSIINQESDSVNQEDRIKSNVIIKEPSTQFKNFLENPEFSQISKVNQSNKEVLENELETRNGYIRDHKVRVDDEMFYIHKFTLFNKSKSPLVVNGIILEVIDYVSKTGSGPGTRVLEEVAVWDIVIKSSKVGKYTYYAKSPVFIAGEDAVIISLRFMIEGIMYGYSRPTGDWTLKVTFLTDNDEVIAESEIFRF